MFLLSTKINKKFFFYSLKNNTKNSQNNNKSKKGYNKKLKLLNSLDFVIFFWKICTLEKIQKFKTMKKIGLYFGLIVVSLSMLLTACNKPSGVLSMVVSPNDTLITNVAPGDTLTWQVSIVPDAVEESTVGEVSVTVESAGVINTLMDSTYNSEGTVNFSFSIVIPQEAQDGQEFVVNITATDGKSGNPISFETTVVVNAEQYQEVSDITLYWNSTDLATNLALLLTKDGAQTVDANSTDAILSYMYNGDASILNTIASPDADEIAQAYAANGITYTTSDKQNTIIAKYTGTTPWEDMDETFVRSYDNEITTDYIAGNPDLGNGVSTLTVGDILIFQNKATGVLGVLRVTNLSTAKFTSNLTVDVKYVVMPASTTAK